MAAPKKPGPKRRAPEPEPDEPRLPPWLSKLLIWAGAIPVIAVAGGYGCEWYRAGEGLVHGAQLAIEHDPTIKEVVPKLVEITQGQEARLKSNEKNTQRLVQLKEKEQLRLEATAEVKRELCEKHKIDPALCLDVAAPLPEEPH